MWKKNQGKRVIVGMSGGVDSAVSAALLLQSGYEVVGLFMKNWEEDDEPKYCSAQRDLADAYQACNLLGIRLETVNFSHEYWENVFLHFLHEYKVGRTPNPDILCNREIKFKLFKEWATILGANYIATGHYARKETVGKQVKLIKGNDPGKDQSYFLYAVDQNALFTSLFPVGHLHKKEVREIATDIGFSVKNKKDSTGICFIGERRFKDFLSKFLPSKSGSIQTLDGETIGRHSGAMFYTIGQRSGLGIGGSNSKKNTGLPWFVARKDVVNNILIAVQGHDHDELFKQTVITERPHWIGGIVPILPFQCNAKTRYRQEDQVCEIVAYGNDHARVVFVQPQRAIAPGQSLVFYQGDHCLGGAIIQQGVNEATEII